MDDPSDINQTRRGIMIGGALSVTAAAMPGVATAQTAGPGITPAPAAVTPAPV
ncbi:MAG: aldehyde dehydrogenase iron-sulfur subunit, partial [Oxalobacteraceae bacterium]